MAIDRTAAKANYISGASSNADKLVKNYVSTPGKLDAARSEAAESLFAEKMQIAIAKKSRQKALGKVNESDMNSKMQAVGATNYRAGTRDNADKQAKNVEPFYAGLDGLEGKYPARTADPMANIDNRVKLVAKTLIEIKARLG